MSDQFVLEMPQSGPSTAERIILGTTAAVMLGSSALGMAEVVKSPDTPVWIVVVTVSTGGLLLILSAAMFLLTLRANKFRKVAAFLTKDIVKLGYTPLEPITVTRSKFRILLRDNAGAALWNVSLRGRKVMCRKSA